MGHSYDYQFTIVDVYVDNMPITPPSSNQSSDSEGGTSPRQTPPNSPIRQVLVARATGYKYNPATAIYSQPVREGSSTMSSEINHLLF